MAATAAAHLAALGAEDLDDGEIALDLAHELLHVDSDVDGLHTADAAPGRSRDAHPRVILAT